MAASVSLIGLSVTWEDPLYSPTRINNGLLLGDILNYSHTLGREGLYQDAQFSMAASRSSAESWFAYGLGRDIKVRNESGGVVFRGFVNQISYNVGGVSAKIGPLIDVVNRIYAPYTPLFILPTQTVAGNQTELPAIQDVTSQGKYGVWEGVTDVGSCLVDPSTGYNEGYQAQQVYLAQFKSPIIEWTTSAPGDISIQLDCLGYYYWFGAYLYQNRTIAPATTTLSAKMAAILAANVNPSVISSSTANIGTNATLTIDKTSGYKRAKDEIASVVTAGDALFNIWWAYLNSMNELCYSAIDTSYPEYTVTTLDSRRSVKNIRGEDVAPWNILPGKLAFLPDWMLAISGPPGVYGSDIRLGIIDQVRFTAPYDFTVSTTRLNKFQSLMDRKGLGGY